MPDLIPVKPPPSMSEEDLRKCHRKVFYQALTMVLAIHVSLIIMIVTIINWCSDK